MGRKVDKYCRVLGRDVLHERGLSSGLTTLLVTLAIYKTISFYNKYIKKGLRMLNAGEIH